MIEFKHEILFNIIEEVDGLLKMHYEELTLHKERVVLNPMWENYAAMEKAGGFAVFTARDEGMLVGYSAFFIHPHMHYKDLVVAANDVLFLHPEYRKGMTGIKLIKFSETTLKNRGVDKLVWHIKFNKNEKDKKDFRAIMHRLHYTDEEVIVGKFLKET